MSSSESIMESTSPRRNRTPTLVGLAVALFALPAFMAIYRSINGDNHSNLEVLEREFGVFLLVGLLIWIIKRWERLPVTSIGLRFNQLRTSLLRGLWFAAIVLAVTVGLYLMLRGLGIHLGEEHGAVFHPSLLVVTVSTLRAGIAEEIFYRGFAFERLQSLTGSKILAGLLPLMIFAISHYRQGVGGVIAAFVLGGILTAFYIKYRDLSANMLAHFLADFVLNVALPFFSGR